jgi:uncharacterized protein YndB with AHSA1/START domain
MSVTSVDTDYDNLTITLIADFTAPIDRVWELWSDPRKLERWIGPPSYPATVEKHDLAPGGEIVFFMTDPEGDKSRGIWRITAVDPPTSLEFTDLFANGDGTPVADLPVSTVTVQLAEDDGGTRMEMRYMLESREDLEKLLGTGVEEGLRGAVGQMDALLA